MSKPFARTRSLASAAALTLGIAACGDGGTGPAVITPEEIAGDFRVCELVFAPVDAPADTINILTRLDTAVSAPRLEILANPVERPFSLVYRRAGFGTQTLSGRYATGARDVQLSINATTERTRLLMPERLNLEYVNGQTLRTFESPATYNVNRSDFEALKGQTRQIYRDQFAGRLTARFVRVPGTCS